MQSPPSPHFAPPNRWGFAVKGLVTFWLRGLGVVGVFREVWETGVFVFFVPAVTLKEFRGSLEDVKGDYRKIKGKLEEVKGKLEEFRGC